MTLREVLQETTALLADHQIEHALSEARYLISSVLMLSPGEMLSKSDLKINGQQLRLIRLAASRRSQREPAAYIEGMAGFYGREFAVGKGVLIPRPDTEILVERVTEKIIAAAGEYNGKINILDTFSGSGCIGLTLSLELKAKGIQARTDLADIDPIACGYARRNASRLAPGLEVMVSQADIWPDRANSSWDVITANPPYIASGQISKLAPEVRLFEPVLALDGGPDGLDLFRVLLSQAGTRLPPGGLLAFEHGFDQADQLKQMACDYGWTGVELFSDYGGNPRVLICRQPSSGGK